MNPLVKVKDAFQNKLLPEKEYALIVKRFPIILSELIDWKKRQELIFQ